MAFSAPAGTHSEPTGGHEHVPDSVAGHASGLGPAIRRRVLARRRAPGTQLGADARIRIHTRSAGASIADRAPPKRTEGHGPASRLWTRIPPSAPRVAPKAARRVPTSTRASCRPTARHRRDELLNLWPTFARPKRPRATAGKPENLRTRTREPENRRTRESGSYAVPAVAPRISSNAAVASSTSASICAACVRKLSTQTRPR